MIAKNFNILKKTKNNLLINCFKKNITGFFQTRQNQLPLDLSKNQNLSQVGIYEAPEWNEINNFLNSQDYFSITPKTNENIDSMYNIWEDCVMSTNFRAKYFGLLPFLVEDRNSFHAKKKFVLKMDLIPEAKQLRFVVALISGVHVFYENLSDVVPLPAEDYKIRHLFLRSKPPSFLDMDMVYGNRKIINMFCFDKQGTWIKEGVEHPLLNLEKSYNEGNWFDHVLWENQWL